MTIRAALIPVKPRHRAKDRLRPALSRRARLGLTRAMLHDVLTALLDSALFVSVTVVTRDRRLRRLCRRLGVHTLLPPPGLRGLNAELTWAVTQPEVAQADRLLVIPGDVPGVRVSELFRLVLPPMERGVRLVPSPDGGTNALVLIPPTAIPFRFGRNSATRHRAEAERAGLRVESVPLTSLASDIDQPEDLLIGRRMAGPRTRRVLSAMENGRLHYRARRRRVRQAEAT
ncbi:MAG: 2-phospho-L-lactate guanylyltransferase [Dehalococcoidia bacterium]